MAVALLYFCGPLFLSKGILRKIFCKTRERSALFEKSKDLGYNLITGRSQQQRSFAGTLSIENTHFI
jgi:hypothetical protein